MMVKRNSQILQPEIEADGWDTGAIRCRSDNYSQRQEGDYASLIVIHNISLPPFAYGSDAVERLFGNRLTEQEEDPFLASLHTLRVSSHFFIDRAGQCRQFVSCNDSAFHAGVSSFRGRSGCNAFSIGIELEGCDFEPFSLAQYEVLQDLLQRLCKKYPIEAVTGHEFIALGRKTDPGHFFDWNRLIDAGLPVWLPA